MVCQIHSLSKSIGLAVRVFANGPGDLCSIPGRVIPKTLKIVLDALALSIIRYGSRVKWSNPGKGVAPSPTPWCSSYWKGSLRVTLDYGRLLYLLPKYCKTFHSSLYFISTDFSYFHHCRPMEFLNCSQPQDLEENDTARNILGYGCTKAGLILKIFISCFYDFFVNL